jgi:DNA-binding HxlR family transcriptional regulator
MKRTRLDGHPCSLAHALDAVGEWWTLLIVRDVAYGVTRFAELQQDLGVSANVLSDRLAGLIAAGVLESVPYEQHPPRSEYALTEKGRELVPALVALMRWGDRWGWPAGALSPVRVVHAGCGHDVSAQLRCETCARALAPEELAALPGEPVPDPPGPSQPGYVSGRRLHGAEAGVRLAAGRG